MANILLIDDELLLRRTLRDLLQRLGHAVFEAEHGRQAMAIVGSTRVDLVMTDLMMPVMDGIETIRALKARFPGVVVVAMSGGCQNATPRFDFLPIAERLGAAATLAKPFTADAVKATLDRWLPTTPPGAEA